MKNYLMKVKYLDFYGSKIWGIFSGIKYLDFYGSKIWGIFNGNKVFGFLWK